MATGLPVAKTLIKYNSNRLEEKDEKRRNQLILSLLSKTYPYNDENAIDFRWSDVAEEDLEDIALANFIESLLKQTDEEIFSKGNWMIDWWLRYHA